VVPYSVQSEMKCVFVYAQFVIYILINWVFLFVHCSYYAIGYSVFIRTGKSFTVSRKKRFVCCWKDSSPCGAIAINHRKEVTSQPLNFRSW